MPGSYKTSPVGIVAINMNIPAATASPTISMPFKGTVLAVSAYTTATSGTCTYVVSCTEGTIIASRTIPNGANELLRQSSMTVKKFARGSVVTLAATVGTSVTNGVLTLYVRPEGQIATTPGDDV